MSVDVGGGGDDEDDVSATVLVAAAIGWTDSVGALLGVVVSSNSSAIRLRLRRAVVKLPPSMVISLSNRF